MIPTMVFIEEFIVNDFKAPTRGLELHGAKGGRANEAPPAQRSGYQTGQPGQEEGGVEKTGPGSQGRRKGVLWRPGRSLDPGRAGGIARQGE